MLGKWVMVDEGEYYNTGEVTWVSEIFVLVRITANAKFPKQSRLFPLEMIAESFSSVFDSEEELNKYLEWLEADVTNRLKIVPIGQKSHE